MKKMMTRLVLALSLSTATCIGSWKIDFVDRKEDLAPIKKLFFASFMEEFKDLTAQEMKLRWSSKEVWAENLFKIEMGIWIDKPNDRWLLKATDNETNHVIASCLLSQDDEDKKAILGVILCVHPDFQHKGVGKSFDNFISSNFPNHSTLKLITGTFNHKAVDFYKKNGFKEIKMDHFALSNGNPYVALGRELRAKL